MAFGSTPALTITLPPCLQVAGHLFEDGKAGSLVDDHGHFYKPLQRGPRGDRERAFYDAVQCMLAAEQAAAALPRSAPVAVPGGGATGEQRSAGAAAALPWHQRRLRQLFPSFKGSLKQRGPMAVMQRDELGLLSSGLMAKLGLVVGTPQRAAAVAASAAAAAGTTLAGSPRQVRQADTHPQQQGDAVPQPLEQQRGFALPHQKQQQHGDAPQQPQQHGSPQRQRDEEQANGLQRQHSWLGERVEEEEVGEQLGRSPDSDDCAEPTGRHLMESFHGGAAGAAAAAAYAEAGCAASCRRHAPPVSGAAAADARWQEEGEQQRQPARERRHISDSARDVYSRPEHAQAAALLGQPAYEGGACCGSADSAATALSVESNSKPFRSPFVSQLLHHSHAPGPGDSLPQPPPLLPPPPHQRQGLAEPAAAGTSPLARVSALVLGPSPNSSRERDWLLDGGSGAGSGASSGGADFSLLPFSVRSAPLLRVIPKYYGVVPQGDGRVLLELEDLAQAYRHPCIVDIKVGFRTWYSQADAGYIQRCRAKDAATTQASLGFKICGMQVFRHGAGGYWRASKRWCKTLPAELVDKALLSFAHNEHGLRPADVYGGATGAIVQLEALEAWFSVQRDFHFYSSSVLLLYEGDARTAEEARVRVRLVDFAHTFQTQKGGTAPRDDNFLAGLRALLARLRRVVHATLVQELPEL